MSNTLFTIKPYKWEKLWVFDDPTVGLVREPFVGGMPAMFELLLAKHAIRDPDHGFVVVFGTEPFPDNHGCLVRDLPADDEWLALIGKPWGTWYTLGEGGPLGWLCPALLKYLDPAPERIYFQVQEREGLDA